MAIPLFIGGTLLTIAAEPASPLRSQVKTDFSRPAQPSTIVFSYADVAAKAQPAVVTVYPATYIPASEETSALGPFDLASDKPKDRPPEEVRGTGSGVVITPDGYILTNHHVIAEATRIFVHDSSSDEDRPAKVIGSDPLTDVALLKIEGTNLPTLTFGDSSAVRPGDVVLALGSPFGLEQTVTLGIVSATGRSMNFIRNGIENFIQTDASINPGNSGGALVDGLGRLVGINSARYPTEFGGASGIGFAIPASLALRVADDLLRFGHARRGYLGVKMNPVETGGAQSPSRRHGGGAVRIVEIEADGAADKAGFQMDDLIVGLNGMPVVTLEKLRYAIAVIEPGLEAEFQIERGGSKMNLRAKLGEAPAKRTAALVLADPLVLQPGFEVVELNDALRFEHGIPSSVKGALVTKGTDSEGRSIDLLPAGSVVMGINGAETLEASTAVTLFRQARAGKVTLRLWQRGGDGFLDVEIEKQGAAPPAKSE